jgi:3-oxoacyl-[acyl-carrier-protein] synthase II
MISNQNKRVVITGIGMITPVGTSTQETYQNLLIGKSGISKVRSCDTSDIDVKIAGEINFDMSNFLDKREQKRMDRFTQLAIIASDEAVKESMLQI